LARRAGKAAARRARQRNVPRASSTPAKAAPAPAVDAADTESTATAVSAGAGPTATRRPVAVRQSAGSQLSAAERSEYHYVERDLRDIGILTVVMAALLLLAWFIFSATGLFS
jgi:hypothetical protein